MGQPNFSRLQPIFRQLITSSINDDIQTLSNTAKFKVGDTVEIWEWDAKGCPATLLGTGIVTGICTNTSIVFDTVIDTSSATFEVYAYNCTVRNGQQFADRIFDCFGNFANYKMPFAPGITGTVLDSPIVGQSTHNVTDSSCLLAGDTYTIICDEGVAYSGTVISTNDAQGIVVVDNNTDLSSFTNCKIVNTSLTLEQQIIRLKGDISVLGSPIEEDFVGDCDHLLFETSSNFVSTSPRTFIDGVKKKSGVCGTVATLFTGAGNVELQIYSSVTGVLGNTIDIERLDPAAPSIPLSITVTGTMQDGDKKISVTLETDVGSAILSTTKDVADALNADSEAKLWLRAIYGGDGLGLQTALAATALGGTTAGLDDATGDYCVVEKIDPNTNLLTGGGFCFISFNVILDGSATDNKNRMQAIPDNSEDINVEYSVGA